MSDCLRECAAAFFRATGKDVTTSEGFVMGVSLELKWMAPSDAKRLLAMLVKEGVLEQRDGYVRPAADLSSVDVPLAYRPPADILEVGSKPKEAPKDMFHILLDKAIESGMERKEFTQACNRITRELNIDMAASALIVVRDRGVDIGPYADELYRSL
jgi:hypothetical protein